MKEVKGAFSKECSIAPFINNDEWMVAEGLRLAPRVGRDPSVWSKTLREKAESKIVRNIKYQFGRWTAPKKSINVPGTLVVYTKNYEKTTFSHNCIQSDIPDILTNYGKNVVKYSWNGRTYSPDTLPFWF